MVSRKRILTGVRPTGSLHLGHYAGALENWVRLQKEYECFFLIADYQVSDYADDIDRVRNSVWEVALDWLSVGLDPEGSHFVVESQVPQHAGWIYRKSQAAGCHPAVRFTIRETDGSGCGMKRPGQA